MEDTNTKGRGTQSANQGRGSGGGRGGGGRSGGSGRGGGGRGRPPVDGNRAPANGNRAPAGERTQNSRAPQAPASERAPTQNARSQPAPVNARSEAPVNARQEGDRPAAPAQSQPANRPAARNTAPHKDLLFQKVAIFVDAENIEMSSLKHHEGRTDYKKILEHVGDREIVRILYYKPIYKDISNDFEAFWVSLGGEIKRPNKNADTFLVIDAVTMAEKIDVAIILGGDKDFLPLMWYLRSRGCKVEIWSWPETTSPEMKEAADYYHPLTEEFVIRKSR